MLLLLAFPLQAQDNVRFYGDLSLSQGAGVKNPVLSAGFGFDKKVSNKVTLDGNALIRRTRKIPGGGYSFAGNTSLRVGEKLFGIGGISVTRQFTDLYTKTSTNIFGGLGYRKDNTVFSGVCYFPDLTSENKVWGARFQAEIFAKRHLFIQPHISVFRFKCFQTQTCNSSGMGVAVGVHF